MNIYTLALFAHVIGAIGYFIGISVWLLALVGMRRAQRVEQVRALVQLTDVSGPVSGASAFLILLAGLYLALSTWSLLTGWILVALISLILMGPTSAILIVPRRTSLVKQLAQEAPEGALSSALSKRIHDSVLFGTVQTVAVLLIGVVFLMTTKPDLLGSAIVMLVALIVGLAGSALVARQDRARRAQPTAPDERS